jgi:hypothetical protein
VRLEVSPVRLASAAAVPCGGEGRQLERVRAAAGSALMEEQILPLEAEDLAMFLHRCREPSAD